MWGVACRVVNRYLVPSGLMFSQFSYQLRKRLKLAPSTGMFFFAGRNKIPPNSESTRSDGEGPRGRGAGIDHVGALLTPLEFSPYRNPSSP
jgi:hypothetical protein